MMFNLREFIKKGMLDAVGKMADYQVILNAAGWLEKGVLTEEDLAQISNLIDAQYGNDEAPEEEQDLSKEETPYV